MSARCKRKAGDTEPMTAEQIAMAWASVEVHRAKARVERHSGAIESWLDRRRVLLGTDRVDAEHRCSFDECVKDDGNGIETIDAKLGIYGCMKSGVYHVCDPPHSSCISDINNRSDVVCIHSKVVLGTVISNHIYGDSDKNRMSKFCPKEMTADDAALVDMLEPVASYEKATSENATARRHRKGLLKRRRTRGRASAPATAVRDQAAQVVHEILYNHGARSALDRAVESRAATRAREAVCRYYRRCEKDEAMPNIVTGDDIYDSILTKTSRVTRPPYDGALEMYYVDAIWTLWKVTTASPFYAKSEKDRRKFHVSTHAIAVLYLLSDGYAVTLNGDSDVYIVFEPDAYLGEHLMKQRELALLVRRPDATWDHAVKHVTDGRKNMGQALRSIATDGENARWLQRVARSIRRRHPSVWPEAEKRAVEEGDGDPWTLATTPPHYLRHAPARDSPAVRP